MKKSLSYVFLILFFQLYTLRAFGQITPRQYIEAYKDLAIKMMEEFGVPASVTLAVAMHESANGNSKVATHLHNHFGIKGPNNSQKIRSSYKGYDSVQASYYDFIRYLKSKKGFSALFQNYAAYDYKNWTHGIGRGGYASSKQWTSQVLALINRYGLSAFDHHPGADALSEGSADEELTAPIEKTQVYIVKKGDTLEKIAKRHRTSIRQLKQENQLRTDRLKIGQQLKI